MKGGLPDLHPRDGIKKCVKNSIKRKIHQASSGKKGLYTEPSWKVLFYAQYGTVVLLPEGGKRSPLKLTSPFLC